MSRLTVEKLCNSGIVMWKAFEKWLLTFAQGYPSHDLNGAVPPCAVFQRACPERSRTGWVLDRSHNVHLSNRLEVARNQVRTTIALGDPLLFAESHRR